MLRLWQLFCQAVTFAVAVLFVVWTFHPEWLRRPLAPAAPLPTIREVAPAAPGEGETTPGLSGSAHAAERASRSVVSIYTSREVTRDNPLRGHPLLGPLFDGESQSGEQPGLGSGVIVSQNGYILTNNHVIEAADAIEVALADGRTAPALVVGIDPDTDLAVLRINIADLPAVTFADPSRARVGEPVLAIGNPFGVGQTVTHGIISALGRSRLNLNTFENFIQTDAAINPGNSGGALVDMNGNLLGINTAIFTRNGGSMGIGFAIPVDLARGVLDQIIRSGSVTRGWMGIEMQPLTAELAVSLDARGQQGVLVAGVMRGGPAARAGVRPGDIIIAIDREPAREAAALLNQVAGLAPGSVTQVDLLRAGKRLVANVEIGRRPTEPRRRSPG
ncbi:MAG: PDZ domain-containing protein [Betaproteobacteria bacterium]|jgi:serine protease DegS/serine protease DegQ|nr:PDZ domain-containing protein [Betaproteobacteria bacterium]